MAKVLCVLYDDPVDGYPRSYARDAILRVEHYYNGQTAPTPERIDFEPGELLGSVSGELGLRQFLEGGTGAPRPRRRGRCPAGRPPPPREPGAQTVRLRVAGRQRGLVARARGRRPRSAADGVGERRDGLADRTLPARARQVDLPGYGRGPALGGSRARAAVHPRLGFGEPHVHGPDRGSRPGRDRGPSGAASCDRVDGRRARLDRHRRRHHVAHRLRRYGAPTALEYATTSAEALAMAALDAMRRPVHYRRLPEDGAVRAAALLAELV